jgi:hypothetical protein
MADDKGSVNGETIDTYQNWFYGILFRQFLLVSINIYREMMELHKEMEEKYGISNPQLYERMHSQRMKCGTLCTNIDSDNAYAKRTEYNEMIQDIEQETVEIMKLFRQERKKIPTIEREIEINEEVARRMNAILSKGKKFDMSMFR